MTDEPYKTAYEVEALISKVFEQESRIALLEAATADAIQAIKHGSSHRARRILEDARGGKPDMQSIHESITTDLDELNKTEAARNRGGPKDNSNRRF